MTDKCFSLFVWFESQMLLVQAAASEILWNHLMVHLLIYQVSVDLDTSGKMQIFM